MDNIFLVESFMGELSTLYGPFPSWETAYDHRTKLRREREEDNHPRRDAYTYQMTRAQEP